MDIYTVLWLFVVFTFFVQNYFKPSINSKIFWIIAIVMIIMVAFRADNIGGDTHTYRQLFLNPNYYDGFGTTEILLPIVNEIIRTIWNNVYFASIVKALLILLPIFILIKKESSNFIFSLFLFAVYSYGGSVFF